MVVVQGEGNVGTMAGVSAKPTSGAIQLRQLRFLYETGVDPGC